MFVWWRGSLSHSSSKRGERTERTQLNSTGPTPDKVHTTTHGLLTAQLKEKENKKEPVSYRNPLLAAGIEYIIYSRTLEFSFLHDSVLPPRSALVPYCARHPLDLSPTIERNANTTAAPVVGWSHLHYPRLSRRALYVKWLLRWMFNYLGKAVRAADGRRSVCLLEVKVKWNSIIKNRSNELSSFSLKMHVFLLLIGCCAEEEEEEEEDTPTVV